VFLAKSKDGDYHQEMHSVVFLKWFENQLMPALKNPSLAVLDNASYHNVKTEDTVATNPLTCAHINSIGLSSQCRTGVLNTSCPCKLAMLSVELNPIELIWAQVKGFVATNNTTFRLKDVKELT
jgi:transposase